MGGIEEFFVTWHPALAVADDALKFLIAPPLDSNRGQVRNPLILPDRGLTGAIPAMTRGAFIPKSLLDVGQVVPGAVEKGVF